MKKLIVGTLLLTTAMLGSKAYADVAEGTINLSGNVPAFFEMQVRGIPGDIDLSPGTIVANRLIGILHFKYNINVGSVALDAAGATKNFRNSGDTADYPFLVDPSYSAPACLTLGGSTVATADLVTGTPDNELDLTLAAQDLVTNNGGLGIEEDCFLQISYSAATGGTLPVADTYALGLTITFTSN